MTGGADYNNVYIFSSILIVLLITVIMAAMEVFVTLTCVILIQIKITDRKTTFANSMATTWTHSQMGRLYTVCVWVWVQMSLYSINMFVFQRTNCIIAGLSATWQTQWTYYQSSTCSNIHHKSFLSKYISFEQTHTPSPPSKPIKEADAQRKGQHSSQAS